MTTRIRWFVILLLFVPLMLTGPAAGQNSIAVEPLTASPGDDVVARISATTDKDITLLSVDLTFSTTLCACIENQVLRKAGRTTQDPLEDGISCPTQGAVKLRLVDPSFTGGIVLPRGSGEIAEWAFHVRSDAPGGTFPITMNVNQSANGPLTVPLTASNGQLTISGAAACPGDCNGDRSVAVDELITGVNIALDNLPLVDCPPFDQDNDGSVTVSELIAAVNAAVNGCP